MIDHILNASLERNIIINIIYENEGGVTQRDIKVIEMNEEYIKAYCYLRHQIRIFKRGSILSAYWHRYRRVI